MSHAPRRSLGGSPLRASRRASTASASGCWRGVASLRGADPGSNIDARTVAGFGDEWAAFDQSALKPAELREHFDRYFAIFPWDALSHDAVGFDLGCGSG